MNNKHFSPVSSDAIDLYFRKVDRLGLWENGKMGKWENGKMGKWENGKMGKKYASFEKKILTCSTMEARDNIIKSSFLNFQQLKDGLVYYAARLETLSKQRKRQQHIETYNLFITLYLYTLKSYSFDDCKKLDISVSETIDAEKINLNVKLDYYTIHKPEITLKESEISSDWQTLATKLSKKKNIQVNSQVQQQTELQNSVTIQKNKPDSDTSSIICKFHECWYDVEELHAKRRKSRLFNEEIQKKNITFPFNTQGITDEQVKTFSRKNRDNYLNPVGYGFTDIQVNILFTQCQYPSSPKDWTSIDFTDTGLIGRVDGHECAHTPAHLHFTYEPKLDTTRVKTPEEWLEYQISSIKRSYFGSECADFHYEKGRTTLKAILMRLIEEKEHPIIEDFLNTPIKLNSKNILIPKHLHGTELTYATLLEYAFVFSQQTYTNEKVMEYVANVAKLILLIGEFKKIPFIPSNCSLSYTLLNSVTSRQHKIHPYGDFEDLLFVPDLNLINAIYLDLSHSILTLTEERQYEGRIMASLIEEQKEEKDKKIELQKETIKKMDSFLNEHNSSLIAILSKEYTTDPKLFTGTLQNHLRLKKRQKPSDENPLISQTYTALENINEGELTKLLAENYFIKNPMDEKNSAHLAYLSLYIAYFSRKNTGRMAIPRPHQLRALIETGNLDIHTLLKADTGEGKTMIMTMVIIKLLCSKNTHMVDLVLDTNTAVAKFVREQKELLSFFNIQILEPNAVTASKANGELLPSSANTSNGNTAVKVKTLRIFDIYSREQHIATHMAYQRYGLTSNLEISNVPVLYDEIDLQLNSSDSTTVVALSKEEEDEFFRVTGIQKRELPNEALNERDYELIWQCFQNAIKEAKVQDYTEENVLVTLSSAIFADLSLSITLNEEQKKDITAACLEAEFLRKNGRDYVCLATEEKKLQLLLRDYKRSARVIPGAKMLNHLQEILVTKEKACHPANKYIFPAQNISLEKISREQIFEFYNQNGIKMLAVTATPGEEQGRALRTMMTLGLEGGSTDNIKFINLPRHQALNLHELPAPMLYASKKAAWEAEFDRIATLLSTTISDKKTARTENTHTPSMLVFLDDLEEAREFQQQLSLYLKAKGLKPQVTLIEGTARNAQEAYAESGHVASAALAGRVNILTPASARGFDFPAVDYLADLTNKPEESWREFIQRIGRIARKGEWGFCYRVRWQNNPVPQSNRKTNDSSQKSVKKIADIVGSLEDSKATIKEEIITNMSNKLITMTFFDQMLAFLGFSFQKVKVNSAAFDPEKLDFDSIQDFTEKHASANQGFPKEIWKEDSLKTQYKTSLTETMNFLKSKGDKNGKVPLYLLQTSLHDFANSLLQEVRSAIIETQIKTVQSPHTRISTPERDNPKVDSRCKILDLYQNFTADQEPMLEEKPVLQSKEEKLDYLIKMNKM